MARYQLFRPLASDPWSAWDELRREMDAVFGRFAPGGASPAGVFPAVNLYETGDAYVLTAELPGVRPEDVQVTLEGPTLSIAGERKSELREADDVAVHRRERQTGSFRRAFELPVPVEADKVEAIQKHGVLVLRLPKSPEHQPRQIAVRADEEGAR